MGLLYGKVRPQVHANASALDTAELLAELEALGIVNPDRPRKQRMDTVVRACRALVRRGHIVEEYVIDADNPGRTTICWQADPERVRRSADDLKRLERVIAGGAQ